MGHLHYATITSINFWKLSITTRGKLTLIKLSLNCIYLPLSSQILIGFLSLWILLFLVAKASLLAQMAKNLPVIQESQVWSLGQEDPLEKGMAIHSSILAWLIQSVYVYEYTYLA